MNFRFGAWGSIALVAAGCVTSPLPPASEPPGPGAELAVQAEIGSPPFQTQALVTPYTGADVVHVVVGVMTFSEGQEVPALAGGNPVLLDLAKEKLGEVVRFRNLALNTRYRIRGWAYKAAGPDPANIISVAANSFVDVEVTNDDRPPVAKLVLRLADKVFAAQASNSISFADGTLVSSGDVVVETAK
jgi:hypothetical protein